MNFSYKINCTFKSAYSLFKPVDYEKNSFPELLDGRGDCYDFTGVLFAEYSRITGPAPMTPGADCSDIATKIKSGKSTARFFADSVDLESSLSPFVALYDDHAQPIRSSGLLTAKIPRLPPGRFRICEKSGGR